MQDGQRRTHALSCLARSAERGSRNGVVPRASVLRMFTYALHTYSRGLSAAQMGPQLGSRPVRLGHVALGGWLDVPTRPQPRVRRSPPASRHCGGHRVHGTCSSAPARHRQAKPLGSHRNLVHQQRSAASCRTRRAGCGQAALCASGSGGEWERCLVGRCGSAEQHGEHQGWWRGGKSSCISDAVTIAERKIQPAGGAVSYHCLLVC